MPIKYFKEDTTYNIKNRRILNQWISNAIFSESHILGQINFIFTSDNYLLTINKEYLKHNYYTDIITFNYCQQKVIAGDIFISIDTILNNSNRFSVIFSDELHRVMIHGVLHLLGYNDITTDEKRAMTQKENHYLERLKNLL